MLPLGLYLHYWASVYLEFTSTGITSIHGVTKHHTLWPDLLIEYRYTRGTSDIYNHKGAIFTTTKVLRYGSHSFTCKQHHTCLCLVSGATTDCSDKCTLRIHVTLRSIPLDVASLWGFSLFGITGIGITSIRDVTKHHTLWPDLQIEYRYTQDTSEIYNPPKWCTLPVPNPRVWSGTVN